LELGFRHRAVTAEPLGLIQPAITALDHGIRGFGEAELRHPDRNRDAADLLAGCATGQLRFGNAAANALGDRRTSLEVGARKHRDQFLAAVAGWESDCAESFVPDV